MPAKRFWRLLLETLVILAYGLMLLTLAGISFSLPQVWGDVFGLVSIFLVGYGTWRLVGPPWRRK